MSVFRLSLFALISCGFTAWSGITTSAVAQTETDITTMTLGRPNYGAPEWLVNAARSKDFIEKKFDSVESKPIIDYKSTITSQTIIGRQPAGSLSGKIVYTMAGHGWTYDANRMTYITQRGLGYGMIEDFGNADQMHIFAHHVFNAGATVVPLRPVDHQVNERIIDNSSPHAELYGKWYSGTGDSYYSSDNEGARYVFASADRNESAVAKFRPYIPEEGRYPVYVWASDGLDRTNQLYRIVHSGGVDEVRVNHKITGKGWVWIGTYHFDKGHTGFVEISNKVIDPYEADTEKIVIADAVRFGNGLGDTPRPAGISGFPREDEGDIYWIENSLGTTADRRLYSAGSDSNATVASPPRTAAYLNNENYGSFTDRILISFHSNAANKIARGAIALFNASTFQRPDFQELLAEIMGAELNDRLKENQRFSDLPWQTRPRNSYNGINFGELRKDYLQNEMTATIIETAFHDNAQDARFLLDPESRIRMSLTSLHGLLKWFNKVQEKGTFPQLPPSSPTSVSAQFDKTKNKIQVQWEKGPVSSLLGSEPQGYRVYRSRNGDGFDGGVLIDGETSFAFEAKTTAPVYIRVASVNSAGESFPGETLAISAKNDAQSKVLLVPVSTILDNKLNDLQPIGLNPGSPYSENAVAGRVRPLNFIYETLVKAEANTLAELDNSFDSASLDAISNESFDLQKYERIFIISGERNANNALIPESVQKKITNFIVRGGNVYLSGRHIASNLKTYAPDFYENLINVKISIASFDKPLIIKGGNSRFVDNEFNVFTIAPKDSKPRTLDILSALPPRTLPLLYTENEFLSQSCIGLIARPLQGKGQLILITAPLTEIKNVADRKTLIQAVLKQL